MCVCGQRKSGVVCPEGFCPQMGPRLADEFALQMEAEAEASSLQPGSGRGWRRQDQQQSTRSPDNRLVSLELSGWRAGAEKSYLG